MRHRDREQFIGFVVNDTLLDTAVEWIRDNLDVETVYGRDVLHKWAQDNGLEPICERQHAD